MHEGDKNYIGEWQLAVIVFIIMTPVLGFTNEIAFLSHRSLHACTMHDIGIATKITLFNSKREGSLTVCIWVFNITHSTQATSFQKENNVYGEKIERYVSFFVYSSTLMIAQRVLYRLHGWFEISRSIIMDNILDKAIRLGHPRVTMSVRHFPPNLRLTQNKQIWYGNIRGDTSLCTTRAMRDDTIWCSKCSVR